MYLEFRTKCGVDNRTTRQYCDDLMTLISRLAESPRVAMVEDSKNEQHKLIKLAQAGDIEARNKLIEQHAWLIDYALKKYFRHSRDDFDDMRGDAVFGLIRAIMGFDPSRSDALSTYALYWIRATVGRIRGKEDRAKLSPGSKSRMLSLNAPTSRAMDDEDQLLEDVIADPSVPDMVDHVSDARRSASMQRAFKSFWESYSANPSSFTVIRRKELVKDIIARRLLADDPETRVPIADDHGVSRENVRLYEEKIMQEVQKLLEMEALDTE